jgi:hypothetical protein
MDTLVPVSFCALSVTAFVVSRVTAAKATSKAKAASEDRSDSDLPKEKAFRRLQLKFFAAYFLALLGKLMFQCHSNTIKALAYTPTVK